jgi:NitT/TauT family transport system substrate-binding protein
MSRRGRPLAGVLIAFLVAGVLLPTAHANPYLAKPGETPVAIRVATCAVTGGFMHFYAAAAAGLFAKYGLGVEHVYMQGTHTVLAALAANEIQFLYCAADATIPGLAAGVEARLVGAPLVGIPYVLLARKDVERIDGLKGKTIGVTRPGDLDHRLMRTVLRRFNIESHVTLRPLGGSQPERYQAMLQDLVQAVPVTPPLDARGQRDGFNVIYRLNDLGLPFVYSSIHTNAKTLKDQPRAVQRFVAAIAEAVHFVEKNPDHARAATAKVLRLDDPRLLDSAYTAYAKDLVNRRLTVPIAAVSEAIELARESGIRVTRTPEELVDNRFADHLERSGFLRALWGDR